MRQLIHIVDDDPSFRAAIGRLLRASDYEIAEYPSADSFLEQVRTGIGTGCILLDVSLPGLSGPDLQARLAELGSSLPIVFLTGHGDVPTIVRAIKAGADDFLTKPVSGSALVDSIERAFQRYYADQTQREWLSDARSLFDKLTPREREVFDHVVRGKLNKQTAHALGITERTIKAHRQHIFDKLGARTVAELVSLAERLGVLLHEQATDNPPVSSLSPSGKPHHGRPDRG
ncbi:response regulator transcription factor [Pseudaminobacter arsenicus]|uniref:Response regulator transcription factor n=1 Tax=Borborobacter arsenicus TaxID=1851146 RepID=A0A432V0Q5_9HYPH|nr:response regulator [Pseudaminobacter arsenicus]RUM95766.1 response regulator transcription factor [Pseudaminobacter arsenicus]